MGWEKVDLPARGGARGGPSTEKYAMKIAMVRDKKHKNKPRFQVVLSKELLRRLKWKVGDHYRMLVNQEMGLIGFQRVADHNERLITADGKKPGVATARARINFTLSDSLTKRLHDGREMRILQMEDLVIDDDADVVAVRMLPERRVVKLEPWVTV